ncbi:uncharacterized protein LOC115768698 [Drosophila novamexicana]|uniref:uncharacterized protein LOC115768698 n=1 Tax=Drosophila novamexicana TaxID=47314 RepID=UPI0011E5DFCC|nr:uncharacterized protein LOC115768698 [Drosophila novamexicana]
MRTQNSNMRLKEYPEIVVDVIPKLYESHIKVFITHLYGMEEQVDRLPKKFCKMYTTQPLASQLLHYLRSRGANISEQDFHILRDAQPFTLRLSDGKRLQLMLCAGNDLGNSLMLLIRKVQGGRLLLYYSAVQQDDLCQLMGNITYQEWIAKGTEVLFLNLQAVDQQFNHVDFEEIARGIYIYGESMKRPTVLQVPLLGYEYLIRRLAQTLTLYGHIKMSNAYLDNFMCLTSDLRRFEVAGYVVRANVVASNSVDYDAQEKPHPLEKLQWSPVPNRMNLIQLCSLLRPLHINGIVAFHASGNVPPVPQFLKRFQLKYSPKSKGRLTEEQVDVPETQLMHLPSQENIPQTQTQQEQSTLRKQPIVILKQRQLHFVDYDDDDDNNETE